MEGGALEERFVQPCDSPDRVAIEPACSRPGFRLAMRRIGVGLVGSMGERDEVVESVAGGQVVGSIFA
jgi:hypothetical protein